MFILVLLLSILSVPRALLKPTTAKGELMTSSIKDEESRFKRQTDFFDLLHQTIEKYVNCDDKALAYPQQFPCPEATNPNQNNPYLKCTKVNLCSLQNYPTAPGNSWDLRIANANQNSSPYFLANEPPTADIDPNGIGNVPVKFSSKYSSRHNVTYFPLNEDILSRLLYRPAATAKRNPVLTTSLENVTEGKTILASGVITITPSVRTNNYCPCLEDAKKTTTELLTSNKLDNATMPEKKENCSCLTAAQPEITATNKTDARSPESNHDDDSKLSSYKESATSSKNLNLLFQQLDEMALSVNNDDLKKILEKLKTYKSAFEINFNEQNCTNSNASSTVAAAPIGSLDSSTHKVFENTLWEMEKYPEIFKKDDNNEFSNNLKTDNLHVLKSINSSATPATNLLNEVNNLPNVTEVKPTLSDLSGGGTFENSNTTTNRIIPASKSDIVQNHDVQHLKDQMKILMSSKNDKSAQKKDSEQNRAATTQVVMSENNETHTNKHTNKTISNIYDQLNSINLHTGNLNKTSNSESAPPTKNSSKITISIISHGSFKNIHVEHSDKHLEIKEKEKDNMETQSSDMMGTGSRHVNIIKQQQMKAPYAEPILSEIYSSKSNFKTKPPLTIYWHKIEEKPSKLKRVPSEVLKAFKSFGINRMESSEEENLPIILRREGIDY